MLGVGEVAQYGAGPGQRVNPEEKTGSRRTPGICDENHAGVFNGQPTRDVYVYGGPLAGLGKVAEFGAESVRSVKINSCLR